MAATDAAELIAHVQDADEIHLPFGYEGHVPQPFEALGLHFHLTKFMMVEVVVVLAMIIIFVPLSRRIARGGVPKGRLWNLFEAVLIFLRDTVARPAIGHHDADRFLPFLWTMFFFILFLNLMGMLPGLGSPTGTLSCTSVLAVVTYFVVLGAGVRKFGLLGYLKGQVPHMDIPLVLAIFLKPMIFVIEIVGLLVKHFVLAMRLFANMFAGHLVLAVITSFIAMTATSYFWYVVMPMSVLGDVALSLLELLVAFIQAYVFTFLAALFIGMSVHQH